MSAVARGLADVPPGPSVVTIGNFDGVHRGHRVLLRRTTLAAAEHGARAVAITFDPHPVEVLRPDAAPPRLQPLEERIAVMHDLGIELVVVLAFTDELAALTPDAFVGSVLVERLQAVRVVVGTNFRFGHRAAGDVVTLVDAGQRYGFATEAVTVLDLDGDPISSSAVRARLADGDVRWAARALARPFTLTGTVVRGDGRGRTIGVPTANLDVPEGLVVPGDGVYVARARWDDDSADAVVNVGSRPTFDGTSRSVEAHLLDVEVDLYGRRLEVAFLERLRGERRFDGPDALVAQIRDDISTARRLLTSG